MRGTKIGILLSTVLVAVGCLNVEEPDPSTQSIAVLAGQVTRADGAVVPVNSPGVFVQLLSAPSGGTARLLLQSAVTATEDGRFVFLFLLNESASVGSVIVSVAPPLGSGLLPLDTAGIPIKIVQGRNPTDTTYVQLPLRAR